MTIRDVTKNICNHSHNLPVTEDILIGKCCLAQILYGENGLMGHSEWLGRQHIVCALELAVLSCLIFFEMEL